MREHVYMISQIVARKRSIFEMQPALGKLIKFYNSITIKFKLRTVAMIILAAHLNFSNICFFSKIAANFFELSRKRVFTASNRNIYN